MIRRGEPLSVLTAIVIAVASVGCFVFVVVVQRLESLQEEFAASDTYTSVDTSGWQTYQNSQYGFTIEYPSQWQISTAGLANTTPFVAFGNPLEGTKTYSLKIFIESNPAGLSSGEYAHSVIDAARASSTLLQFDRTEVPVAGTYPAYELYNVFEFDHNAERIYTADSNKGNKIVLRFDFPVAQENPNVSLPVANNGVAHEIVNTLVFTN